MLKSLLDELGKCYSIFMADYTEHL